MAWQLLNLGIIYFNVFFISTISVAIRMKGNFFFFSHLWLLKLRKRQVLKSMIEMIDYCLVFFFLS